MAPDVAPLDSARNGNPDGQQQADACIRSLGTQFDR